MPPGRKKKRALGVQPKDSGEDEKTPAETNASLESSANVLVAVDTKKGDKKQKRKKLEAQNLESENTQNESHSEDDDDCSKTNGNSDPSASLAIRRPTYWLEMRGIKSSENSLTGTEETPSKKKRLCNVKNKVHDSSDEDYTCAEPKQKSKPKARHVRKDPPSYPAGSTEAHWYLEIQDRGRITCPTCRGVKRKTVEGLKKHMANCKGSFKCPHCQKELRSAPGMRYHIMAEHSTMTVPANEENLDSQSERDRLRILLKRMGRIKCTKEGCLSNFTTIVGYLYHVKKCGKGEAELEQMALKCHRCGKAYQSRGGLVYHMKSEHDPVVYHHDNGTHEDIKVEEDSCEGRSRRRSAKVAIYHLHEIATEELMKEWPKRKVLQDLVPEETKLKFSRPGLPTFSQEVIRKWRTEMKTNRRLRCPNKGCDSVYGSISGLKAHLGCCTQGDFIGGKYKCLICEKEFGSESGVKYHINCVHSEEWFVVSNKPSKSFEKMMKTKPKEGKKKLKKKKQATTGIKKKLGIKKTLVKAKEPPIPTLINGSERSRNMPSESESEGKASSQSSLEDEGQSVVWRARQPIVKPSSLSPVKTEEQNADVAQEAKSKPGQSKSREVTSALNLVLEKTEPKPGSGKTSALKPGLIKAAVLKLDRRRK